MNLLLHLLFISQIIHCTKRSAKIRVVPLLISNIWKSNRDQIRTANGYLNEILISLQKNNGNHNCLGYYPSNCHYDYDNQQCYIILCNCLTRYIFSSESFPDKDNRFLKFKFTYNDLLLENQYNFITFKGKKQVFEGYKNLIKISNDQIDLKSDGINVRMTNIKELIRKLINYNLTSLNNFILDEDEKYIKQTMKSSLLYFKSPLSCLNNLKEFAKSTRFLQMINNESYSTTTKKNLVKFEERNIIEISYFRIFFNDKFDKLFHMLKGKMPKDLKIIPVLRSLVYKSLDYLTHLITSNQLFLPIEETYNINYYFDHITSLILESIIEMVKGYSKYSEDQLSFFFTKIMNTFILQVEEMKNTVINKLCEFKYVPEYFSRVIDKEIKVFEDYVEIEKIVCDFHNMMACIYNKHNKKISALKINFDKPTFDDGYEYRIIKAIEITHGYPTKNFKMKTYTLDGKEINLDLNVDYFTNRFSKIFISSEKIREKNIHSIEVFDKNNDYKENFTIRDYLGDKNNEKIKEISKIDQIQSYINSLYSDLFYFCNYKKQITSPSHN